MVIACPNYPEEISAFLDGQLDENRKAEVSEHLSECGVCRRQLQEFTELSDLISAAWSPAHLKIPDLWVKIQGQVSALLHPTTEELSAFIDNELPAAGMEGVREHIGVCASCKSRLRQLSQATNLVAKALALPAGLELDLWEGVRSRLNADCQLILGELSAYLDKEVTTLRHRAITSHIIECPECRGAFNQLSSLGELIRTRYSPLIPDEFDLWAEIKGKLKVVRLEPKVRSGLRPAAQRFYLASACAVLLAVIGLLTYLLNQPLRNAQVSPVSAEAYLLESALMEPGSTVEAVVYEYP